MSINNRLSDLDEITALNTPCDTFQAISEVSISVDPLDIKRLVFEFEPTDVFFEKIGAIRQRKLRVEPMVLLHTRRMLYQQVRSLNESRRID